MQDNARHRLHSVCAGYNLSVPPVACGYAHPPRPSHPAVSKTLRKRHRLPEACRYSCTPSHGIQRQGIAEGVGKRAGFGVHLVALGNGHTDFSTEKGGFYKYPFQFEIGVIALGFIQLGQKAVGIQRVTLLPGQIVETEAVVKSGDDLMDYTFLFFSPRIRFICCRCNYCAPEPK